MAVRVFINGCFDLLHVGHVEFIQSAAQLGELTIGVNGDESVKRLKGSGRPIHSIGKRMQMLKSIKRVHKVLSFADDDPTKLLQRLFYEGIGPDIVVKGIGYSERTFPELNFLQKVNVTVVFHRPIYNISTTGIISAIKNSGSR